MSLNWVMLDSTQSHKFIPLPGESKLHTSPLRVAFSLTAPSYASQKYELKCKEGVVVLTSQRIIYLPTTPTKDLESFSAPIPSIQDSYVQTPYFGPNHWVCTIQATPDGGLPLSSEYELKLTFKEGGAFDFHSAIERVKENLHFAMEEGIKPHEAILEDLPSYDGGPPSGPPPGIAHSHGPPPPDGPPPGYEEAQMDGLNERLNAYASR